MPRHMIRTKAAEAYRILKKKVTNGELSPGERLTEQKVAEVTDVGRATAREAMLRLESEGFLKGRGAYGGKLVGFFEHEDPDDIIHNYELQELIDGLAARLAARNMNGWQIDELRLIGEEIAAAWHSGDRDSRLEAAGKFHRYIVMNCGNPLLASMWESHYLTPLILRLPGSEEQLWSLISEAELRDTEHILTVEGICSHNPDVAEAAALQHVRRVTDAIRRFRSTRKEDLLG